MRLERRVLGYLTVVMAVLSALLVAGTSAAILMNADRADRESAHNSVDEALSAVESQKSDLAGNAMDWANWDPSYRFARGEYPEYIEDNLPLSSMGNLDINVFAIYDKAGRLLHSTEVDSVSRQRTIVPGIEPLLDTVPRLNTALGLGSSVSGLVRLPDGRPMLVASAPIYPTERGRRGAAGSLVLGRLLDESRLSAISQAIQQQVEVHDVAASRSGTDPEPVRIAPREHSQYSAALRLPDLNGRSAHELVVTTRRDARSTALVTLVLLTCGLLALQLSSVFVLRYGLRDIVLERILTLNSQVDRIRRSGQAEHVVVHGNDELSSLAENVDGMVQALEQSRADLQATHDELELRVADRTAELSRAIFELEEQVDARHAAEEERAASEARYRLLIDNLSDTVFTLDAGGCIEYMSPGVEWAFGYKPEELVGKPLSILFTPSSAASFGHQFECGLGRNGCVLSLDGVTATGEELHVEVVLSPIDASVGAIQGIIRDVTARRRYEDELLHIASHDFLTGLANRRRFEEELERTLATARRHGTQGAVLWIDLDNFKDVNDTLGHHSGDELLVDIARSLRASVRAESVLARLGGDEFAVLLPIATREQAREAGERLLTEISKVNVFLEGRVVRAHGSMGIVMFPDDGLEVDELLARADMAMYRAKQLGRARSVFFTREQSWHDDIGSRRAWAERIEQALRHNTFGAFAQPIVNLADGNTRGFELLARIPDDAGGFVGHARFIGVAERTGLVVDIDLWMLAEAVRILREFEDSRVKVDVNVSPRTLGDERFITAISQLLKDANFGAERLGVEIIESAASTDFGRAQDALRDLKRIGCRVSLDSFGSGFCSFLHLKQLPVDMLKIDGGFVGRLQDSPGDEHLVRAMVELARGLGMGTIAECVETAETMELLRVLGVDAIQGNHVGPPGPARDVIRAELVHSEARAIAFAALRDEV